MSDLEQQISRYLDGELTPAELERLRLTLSDSSEARSLLREMTSIRSAARGGASLRRPSRRAESELFRRLRTEGLYAENGIHRQVLNHKSIASARRQNVARWSALVAALTLFAVIGGDYWLNHEPLRPVLVASNVVTPHTVHLNPGDAVAVPSIILSAEEHRSTRHVAPHGRGDRSTQSVSPAFAAIPQPSVNNTIDSSHASQTSSPDIAGIEPQPQREPKSAVLLPASLSNKGADETGVFAASFRPRVAYIDKGDGATTTELNFRLDAQIAEGQQLSLIVGKSATVIETRHQSTGIFISRTVRANPEDSPGGQPSPELVSVKPYEMAVQQEGWIGLGYNYSVAMPIKNARAGVGVMAGASTSSWRFGIEIPATFRLTKGVTLEVALSATHVIPRDLSVNEFTVDNSSDGLLYRGESARSTFTSLGGELGIRVDLK